MIFLLYTVIALIANASMVKIIHISIQPGQWLGIWQKQLAKWDEKGNMFLAKAGGLCEVCFSHAMTFIFFWVYLISMVHVFDIVWYAWILWYFIYVSIGTILSLYFINRLF
jgi:hypothetical protein